MSPLPPMMRAALFFCDRSGDEATGELLSRLLTARLNYHQYGPRRSSAREWAGLTGMIPTMEHVRTSVSDGTRNYPIEGTCDPRFLPVLDAFKKNFADSQETGVCVSVMHEGKPVVDLWGGFTDRAG